ncbi:hypothetical protein [Vogesella indigofera]|uniref:hypothetical protein n=1 Tax=Vogesella indigofera TaxID=45465 RepID=UPI00234DA638|nr:hypothetical protein [Vogesella indigofera]MDC7704532.1 hypothetical protein [Vogesella indigofera]
MATVFQQYLDAVQANQQRMLAAQADCWRSWCQLSQPTAGTSGLIGQLDAPMMSSASVLQASADAQHDLLLVLERWFGEQQKTWLRQSPLLSAAPCTLPLDLGFSGYLIASRASRQIQHFASTRFSYATLSAVRGAHHAYRKCRNNPVTPSVFYPRPTI